MSDEKEIFAIRLKKENGTIISTGIFKVEEEIHGILEGIPRAIADEENGVIVYYFVGQDEVNAFIFGSCLTEDAIKTFDLAIEKSNKKEKNIET